LAEAKPVKEVVSLDYEREQAGDIMNGRIFVLCYGKVELFDLTFRAVSFIGQA
jgi:hypothetical protein